MESLTTSALYISHGVWHSPLTGHSFFTLELNPNDCCFCDKMLRLWEDMIETNVPRGAITYLDWFLLNILCMVWFRGKCLESRRKNILPMLLFSLLEKGGLNQIIFRFLFHCFLLVVGVIQFNASLKPLSFKASLYGFIDWWKIPRWLSRDILQCRQTEIERKKKAIVKLLKACGSSITIENAI